MDYKSDTHFNQEDFSSSPLLKSEYENCKFTNCDFSSSNLSEIKFVESKFIDCNFSNADVSFVSLVDVIFKNCKMIGLQFETMNEFGFAAEFDNCQLDHSSFYKMKIGRTSFRNCQLHNVDFTEADIEKIDIKNSINETEMLCSGEE